MIINWVDVLCLIIILKSAVEGFSRGLIISAFKTAGVIVALYVGIFYREAAVKFLKGYLPLEETIGVFFQSSEAVKTGADAVYKLGLKSLMDMAMGALGFFLVFLGVQFVFSVMAFLLTGVAKLTKMTPSNRALGLVFGIARSAILIALVSAALSPFVIALTGSWLERGISSSYILMHLKFLDFITPIMVKLI